MVEIDTAKSSITIKEMGSVKRRQDGKEIKQEVVMKIYSDKNGVEAEKELLAIKGRWDKGKGGKEEADFPPQQLSRDV